MSSKKCGKSKFISEDIKDLMNESQFLKDSPLTKKTIKRAKPDNLVDDGPQINQIGNKKRKIEADIEASTQSRQKILDVMDQQLISRKKSNENLFKCLSDLISQLESDHTVMKENEQKLEQLTAVLNKCIQQATVAHKQILKALKEIHDSFMKQCDEMQSEHKAETNQLADELAEDIKKLQQKLVLDTKRSGWEAMRRTIFHAMQNDF
ncbi:uncharacterized protein LOC101742370 [Bombyx mori]|uniref:XLR/SYCP3/FAM9 domain-containing protein n=1 Tax=Bombyx mori TaxID=7091 RepID=A0A8R1WL14_BOMMO|nr:uncharacterized protein LOC101742370 [Bombyx mori]